MNEQFTKFIQKSCGQNNHDKRNDKYEKTYYYL